MAKAEPAIKVISEKADPTHQKLRPYIEAATVAAASAGFPGSVALAILVATLMVLPCWWLLKRLLRLMYCMGSRCCCLCFCLRRRSIANGKPVVKDARADHFLTGHDHDVQASMPGMLPRGQAAFPAPSVRSGPPVPPSPFGSPPAALEARAAAFTPVKSNGSTPLSDAVASRLESRLERMEEKLNILAAASVGTSAPSRPKEPVSLALVAASPAQGTFVPLPMPLRPVVTAVSVPSSPPMPAAKAMNAPPAQQQEPSPMLRPVAAAVSSPPMMPQSSALVPAHALSAPAPSTVQAPLARPGRTVAPPAAAPPTRSTTPPAAGRPQPIAPNARSSPFAPGRLPTPTGSGIENPDAASESYGV